MFNEKERHALYMSTEEREREREREIIA